MVDIKEIVKEQERNAERFKDEIIYCCGQHAHNTKSSFDFVDEVTLIVERYWTKLLT